MTPVTSTEEAALELAADLAKELSMALPAFVPD